MTVIYCIINIINAFPTIFVPYYMYMCRHTDIMMSKGVIS